MDPQETWEYCFVIVDYSTNPHPVLVCTEHGISSEQEIKLEGDDETAAILKAEFKVLNTLGNEGWEAYASHLKRDDSSIRYDLKRRRK